MGSMAQMEYVIRGLRRKAQAPKRMRLPISPDILEEMRRRHPSSKDMTMLWAAATMCFSGSLEWVRL